VGSETFVGKIQAFFGNKANTIIGDKCVLREMPMPYTVNTGAKNNGLSSDS